MERPTHNLDGSFTFHVLVGFSFGIVDIHQFFPSKIYVAPGDNVEFKLSKSDMAPHTTTFLNGSASPDTFVILPQPNAPPLILVNPKVMFPANAGQPLTDQGYYNSGFMVPGSPNTSFTFPIGQFTGVLPFECLLHDEMGMNGNLVVAPRKVRPHDQTQILGPNGLPLLFMALVHS
jgi:plastocyanin